MDGGTCAVALIALVGVQSYALKWVEKSICICIADGLKRTMLHFMSELLDHFFPKFGSDNFLFYWDTHLLFTPQLPTPIALTNGRGEQSHIPWDA